jgi:hypothetical protein
MNLLRRWRNRNNTAKFSGQAKTVHLQVERLETRIVPITSVTDLTSLSPTQLVQDLIGGGVTASNIQYTGAQKAAGIFAGGSQSINIETGVVLSTGWAKAAVGPNDSPSSTQVNGTPSDPQLNAIIAPTPGFDASVLQFDFVPLGSTVTFNYVFGSEEYPEFAPPNVSIFNDVFAFFLNNVNVALIPGTNKPVSIANVNAVTNSQFYVDNTMPVNVFGPGTFGSHFTQMDAFTTVLQVHASVNPGVPNHIKLAIENAGDENYDSWVMIQAGSLASPVLRAYHPFRYDYIGGHYLGNVTVVNNGNAPAPGPLFLLLQKMPPGVSLVNPTGYNNGVPYITINSSLGVGQDTLVPIVLSDPSNSPISTFFLDFPLVVSFKLNTGIGSQLTAPATVGPSGTLTSTPTFTWQAVPGVTDYDVWVNNLSTGQQQVIRATNVTGTSFTPAQPLPPGQYAWWVASMPRGLDMWSGTAFFSITLPAPSLLGPLGQIANLMPTFSWGPVAAADHYDLWVNNLTTGQRQIIRNANVSGTSFSPAFPLVPGDTYAWWVASVASNGMEFWSATGTFTEAGLYPTTVGPSGPITSLTPTFSWNSVTAASSYDLWVDDISAGQSQIIRQSVTGTVFVAPTSLQVGHSYRWWVAAVDGTGQEYWSATTYFWEPFLPAPTTLGASQGGNPVTFQWNAVAGADHYDVWVNDLTTGQAQVFRNANVAGTSVTGGVPPGHGFQWWVAAVDNIGHESWSSAATFVSPALLAPTLVAPAGLIFNTAPIYSWNAVAAAVQYDIWVNDLTTGQSQVVRTTQTGTTLLVSTPLLSGHRYAWWVASVDSSGFESWSTAGYFNEA